MGQNTADVLLARSITGRKEGRKVWVKEMEEERESEQKERGREGGREGEPDKRKRPAEEG